MLSRLDRYGPHFTSHDCVKLVAILLMFIDHIGFFFYPDELWWRAVGRMTFPLFFFLAGYARPGHLDRTLLVFALLMVAVDALTYSPIFALNILFTMLFCRWFVQQLEERNFTGERSEGLFIMLFIWAIPTSIMVEYGTLACMYATCGYLIRREADAGLTARAFVYTLVGYVIIQSFGLGFTPLQWTVMATGCAVELYILYHYRMKHLPAQRVPRAVITQLLVLTRYSLYVYCIHFVLFQLIEYALHPERHTQFTWVSF